MGWNNIGNKIKEMRIAYKLTQDEFASRIRVSKSTVSSYENGTRAPSYDVLVKIAEYFHVSTDNLLGRNTGYAIDVSTLTLKQRATVQDVVTTYQAYNELQKLRGAGDKIDSIYDGEIII